MWWQVQDAKQRFSELLRTAHAEGPQIVTRHGEETAVVIDIADYRHMHGDVAEYRFRTRKRAADPRVLALHGEMATWFSESECMAASELEALKTPLFLHYSRRRATSGRRAYASTTLTWAGLSSPAMGA